MAPWVKAREGVVLRKIDIVKWESAAAAQMTESYNVEGIPYVRVYDRKGKFVGEVRGADFNAVKKLVEKGL